MAAAKHNKNERKFKMNYVNKIELVGRIGTVNFYEKEGNTALRLSVATRHEAITSSLEVISLTTWHNIAVFGDKASELKNLLKKGLWIKVCGSITKRKWEGKIYDQVTPDHIEVVKE